MVELCVDLFVRITARFQSFGLMNNFICGGLSDLMIIKFRCSLGECTVV